MKKIVNLLLLLAIILVTASCDREKLDYSAGEGNEGNGQGENLPTVELNLRDVLKVGIQETGVTTPTTRGVSTDDFIVSLLDQSKKEVNSWVYKDMPDLISIVQGKYYIKARSHALQPVDTRAYYEGISNEFSVTPGAITEVEPILCGMANIEVQPIIDEALSVYLGTDVVVTVTVGNASYSYTDIGNLSKMYFAPTAGEESVVYVAFSGTVDGYKEEFIKTYTSAPGQILNVTFTLKNVTPDGEIVSSGTVGLRMAVDLSVIRIDKNCNISMAEEIIDEDDDNDDGSDDANVKPVVEGRGFDIEVAQYVPKGDEGMVCIVDITAINRIANLFVTIESETLTEKVLNDVGLVKSFDLAYPGDLESALGKDESGDGLGFPVSDQVIGQKNLVFDITSFTPLLNIYGAATHQFIIKVIDKKGNTVEKNLTLITQ